MDYYKLKLCEDYWTIQKTTVDCKKDPGKYEGKTKLLISPRGRASFWLSSQGGLRVYTDKTIKDYYSDQEYNDILNKYSMYTKESEGGVYYCSRHIDKLIPLIPGPLDPEITELLRIIKKTKIQNSHRHNRKESSNIQEPPKDDEFFGLFNDLEE